MKIHNIKQAIRIIFYSILIFGLIGCEDSTSTSNLLNSSSITGKAIDGYLQDATGCLDLNKDGNCTSDEPIFTTDINGSFSLDINVTHKAHKNYKTASLLIYGGIDKDTGNAFLGKLKTIYTATKKDYNISPITTILESLVRDESKTEAEAKKLVLDMLDLKSADLYQDPIELAKTDSSLLKASLQIQKSIEMVSISLTNKDLEKNKIENLYKNLAKHLITNKNDKLAAHLDNIISSHKDLEDDNKEDIKSRTITIITQINNIIQTEVTNTQDIGIKIRLLQNEIKDKNKTDIDKIDFNKIKEYSFSEARARNILISIGDDSKDKDKIKNIQNVLGEEQLSREEEIKRLQDQDKTKTIGESLESYHRGIKDKYENEQLLINPEINKFSLPFNTYFFDDENYQISLFSLKSDLKLKHTEFDLDKTSREFKERIRKEEDERDNFVFINGKWEKEDLLLSSFSLSTDKIKIIIPAYPLEIQIAKKIDISNTKFRNGTFSQGAKKYSIMLKRLENRHSLQNKIGEYNSLLKYIKENGRFKKDNKNNILDINGKIISELSDGVVIKDLGHNIWRIKKLPNSDEIILVQDNDNDNKNEMLYAIKDGSLYEGYFVNKGTGIDNNVYNKIAIEDIKRIIKADKTIIPTDETGAQIIIKNDIIYFKGETSKNNYELLLSKVLKYPNINFKKIIINSKGGDTIYGIKIANFIIDKKLDVEVEEMCFSSCANYIFPAGKIKHIQKNAFVGWHGSRFQGLLLKSENQTFEEYQRETLKNSLSAAGITDKNTLEQEYQTFKKGLFEEEQFFTKIKTNIALALFGLGKLSNDKLYMGWTYSIEDMRKFGINNIIYQGEENEYPNIPKNYKEKLLIEVYEEKKAKEIGLMVSKYIEDNKE